MTVAEPFGLGSATRHSLAEIAAEAGAEFVQGTVVAVDAGAHQLGRPHGPDLEFDTLILAPGARQISPSPNAITFGREGSGKAIAEMLERLRGGAGARVTFVAPSMTGWLLPLYELALMTARELARSQVDGVHLRLVTPEARPLALFGDEASDSVARLLAAAGIEYRPDALHVGTGRRHRGAVAGHRLRRHAAAPARPGTGRRPADAAAGVHPGRRVRAGRGAR